MPARLLGIGLPLTIAAGTLVGVGVLPGVSLVEALVLSIMLACTDAALGQAVVTDERIPSRIRQGLNVESGLNDGICVPLFFIALAVAEWDEGDVTAHFAVAPGARGDRLRPGRRRGRGHRSERFGAARDDAQRARREALAADPHPVVRAARGRHRARPRRQHLHRRLQRRVRLRRHGPRSAAARCRSSSTRAASCSTPSRSSSSAPPILGPALDDLTWQVVVYAVLSLTRRPDAAGRARVSRHRRAAAHGRRSSGGSARGGSRRSSSR